MLLRKQCFVKKKKKGGNNYQPSLSSTCSTLIFSIVEPNTNQKLELKEKKKSYQQSDERVSKSSNKGQGAFQGGLR